MTASDIDQVHRLAVPAMRGLTHLERLEAESIHILREVVVEALAVTLVPIGSVGPKALAVRRGQADTYLHTGGQYEWDNRAPAAVARAAGLHVSRADGSDLVYNRATPYPPDLLICRKENAPARLTRSRPVRPT